MTCGIDVTSSSIYSAQLVQGIKAVYWYVGKTNTPINIAVIIRIEQYDYHRQQCFLQYSCSNNIIMFYIAEVLGEVILLCI